ncbi:MAG: sulfotransferase [Alphaproteobacteria bacterium]
MNQKSVVVLGLARSGTSVVAAILRTLGVNMGPSVRDKANPYGSFEDRDFADLHKKIFDFAGKKTYWHPPTPEAVLALKEQCGPLIRDVVEKKLLASPVWGWKHPRTILTLDLFLPHLENPHLIAIFRNPLGIAKSSVEHTKNYISDKVDFFQALSLVNFYSAELCKALERHRELPTLTVTFEDVVSQPMEEALRMADFLQLELTKEKKEELERLVIPRDRIAQEKAMAAGFFTGKIPRLWHKYQNRHSR